MANKVVSTPSVALCQITTMIAGIIWTIWVLGHEQTNVVYIGMIDLLIDCQLGSQIYITTTRSISPMYMPQQANIRGHDTL